MSNVRDSSGNVRTEFKTNRVVDDWNNVIPSSAYGGHYEKDGNSVKEVSAFRSPPPPPPPPTTDS